MANTDFIVPLFLSYWIRGKVRFLWWRPSAVQQILRFVLKCGFWV